MYAKSLAAFVAISILAVSAKSSGDLKLNTPQSAAQCCPFSTSWSGGEGPYSYKIEKVGGPKTSKAAMPPLHSKTTSNSMHYKPKLGKGQQFIVHVTDRNGKSASCQPITVGDGPSDCLGDGSDGNGIGEIIPGGAGGGMDPDTSGGIDPETGMPLDGPDGGMDPMGGEMPGGEDPDSPLSGGGPEGQQGPDGSMPGGGSPGSSPGGSPGSSGGSPGGSGGSPGGSSGGSPSGLSSASAHPSSSHAKSTSPSTLSSSSHANSTSPSALSMGNGASSMFDTSMGMRIARPSSALNL